MPWVVRWEAWERPRLCCPWGRGCWGPGSAACCASLPREAAARAASTGPVRVAAAAALRSRLPAPPLGTVELSGLSLRVRDPRGSGGRQGKPRFPNAYSIPAVPLMGRAEMEVLGSHFSTVPEIVLAKSFAFCSNHNPVFLSPWAAYFQLSNLRQSKVAYLVFDA